MNCAIPLPDIDFRINGSRDMLPTSHLDSDWLVRHVHTYLRQAVLQYGLQQLLPRQCLTGLPLCIKQRADRVHLRH